MARRSEQQRLDMERAEKELLRQEKEKERERQAERERLEALKLPSTAQWASNPGNTTAGMFNILNMSI